MRNSFLSFFVAVIFVISLSSAAKAETFYAYLSAAQEVPTNASTATGYARVFINESTGTLNFTVVFNNLSSNQIASHIHAPAPIGANVGVAINFGAVGGTSGTITGSTTVTPTQLAQIRAHQGYVNVHSANFSGGEIRGQLGIKRPVDFDGDGRQDIAVLKFPQITPPGVAQIEYWSANSTAGVQITSWGDANLDFPVPGDYDGDGKDDHALYRTGPTLGAQSTFFILRSTDNTALIVAYGVGGDLAHCRDYDGDGITDLALFREGPAPGDPAFWWIKQSTTNTDRVEQFGVTGALNNSTLDTPVSGDYDGDGKFDLAVYRFGISPTNHYIIKQSSDGAVLFKPFGNFQSDYILPGDYDGDGKYDLAIARTGALVTSPLVWMFLDSSTGSFRVVQHGISSDFPVQGDYDGDARADIAIYRQGATTGATSVFWIRRSFDSVTQVTPWGVSPNYAVARFDSR